MPPRWGLGCFHGAAGYKHAVPPELGETVLKQNPPELCEERHDPGYREYPCRSAGAWNVFTARRTFHEPARLARRSCVAISSFFLFCLESLSCLCSFRLQSHSIFLSHSLEPCLLGFGDSILVFLEPLFDISNAMHHGSPKQLRQFARQR